jgi:hypothetical protein
LVSYAAKLLRFRIDYPESRHSHPFLVVRQQQARTREQFEGKEQA